jgi:hypothetical protein
MTQSKRRCKTCKKEFVKTYQNPDKKSKTININGEERRIGENSRTFSGLSRTILDLR